MIARHGDKARGAEDASRPASFLRHGRYSEQPLVVSRALGVPGGGLDQRQDGGLNALQQAGSDRNDGAQLGGDPGGFVFSRWFPRATVVQHREKRDFVGRPRLGG